MLSTGQVTNVILSTGSWLEFRNQDATLGIVRLPGDGRRVVLTHVSTTTRVSLTSCHEIGQQNSHVNYDIVMCVSIVCIGCKRATHYHSPMMALRDESPANDSFGHVF